MSEVLAQVLNASRMNTLHRYRVLKNMGVTVTLGNPCDLRVLLNQPPKLDSSDRKNSLITVHFPREFKQSGGLIEERIRVLHQGLAGLQRAL